MSEKTQTAPVSHTPGPWRHDDKADPECAHCRENGYTADALIGADGSQVLKFGTHDSYGPNEADWELIASAPKLKADRDALLEALKKIVARAQSRTNAALKTFETNRVFDAIDEARAAIEQAEPQP